MDTLMESTSAAWDSAFRVVESRVKRLVDTQLQSQSAGSGGDLLDIWSSITAVPMRCSSIDEALSTATSSLSSIGQTIAAVKSSSGSGNSHSLSSDDWEALEWSLISRVCLLLYGAVVEHLLIRQSVAFTASASYWDSMLRAAGWGRGLIYYAVQTAPWRSPRLVIGNNPFAFKLQLLNEVHVKRELIGRHLRELAAVVGWLFDERPLALATGIRRVKLAHIRKSVSATVRTLTLACRLLLEYFQSQSVDDAGAFSPSDTGTATPPRSDSATELNTAIAGISSARSGDVFTVESAKQELYQLLDAASHLENDIQSSHDQLCEPRGIVKTWPSVAFYSLAAIGSASYLLRNWTSILKAFVDAGLTGKKFFVDWIKEPLVNIYRTIRHENGLQLSAGAEGVHSSLESLERMVVDYIRDTRPQERVDPQLVIERVHHGDLGAVMHDYEGSIKKPIINSISGSMLRNVLIQVQKSKLDLELAMQALDKLLRSQELNFAFLAVAPTLIITGGLARLLSRHYNSQSKSGDRRWRRMMMHNCRIIEKCLIREVVASEKNFDSRGRIIIHLFFISQQVSRMPDTSRVKLNLAEDINDLLDPAIPVDLKLRILDQLKQEMSDRNSTS